MIYIYIYKGFFSFLCLCYNLCTSARTHSFPDRPCPTAVCSIGIGSPLTSNSTNSIAPTHCGHARCEVTLPMLFLIRQVKTQRPLVPHIVHSLPYRLVCVPLQCRLPDFQPICDIAGHNLYDLAPTPHTTVTGPCYCARARARVVCRAVL